jgi:hypothetical protein
LVGGDFFRRIFLRKNSPRLQAWLPAVLLGNALVSPIYSAQENFRVLIDKFVFLDRSMSNYGMSVIKTLSSKCQYFIVLLSDNKN